MNKEQAWELARHWVAAWNAHDLDLIMTHYDKAIELTSPVAARLLEKADGKVAGKANVRPYFQRGLDAYPDLRFQLEDVLWGLNSVVLYYKSEGDAHGGVHGVVGERKSDTRCCELQRLGRLLECRSLLAFAA